MAKAIHAVVIILLWFGFGLLFSQSLTAQIDSERAARDQSEAHRQSPKSTDLATMSETEPPASEKPGEANALINRIVRIGENVNLSMAETVDSIILLAGNARIYGHVNGDIFVFKGDVEIKEGASVSGKVTVVLGKIVGKEHLLSRQTQPRLDRYKELNGWRLIPAVISVMMEGIPQEAWGPKKHIWFGWELMTFITLTIAHVLLVLIFPQQIGDMAHTISHHPGKSTVIGLLILVIVPFLSMLLILSIVGIPLMLLLCAVLLVMAICGRTAIFLSIGGTIFPQQSKAVATVVGYWIYRMATVIPHLNLLTFTIASVIGIGLCIKMLIAKRPAHSPRGYRLQRPPTQRFRRL
jgi:hypothetical protein